MKNNLYHWPMHYLYTKIASIVSSIADVNGEQINKHTFAFIIFVVIMITEYPCN